MTVNDELKSEISRLVKEIIKTEIFPKIDELDNKVETLRNEFEAFSSKYHDFYDDEFSDLEIKAGQSETTLSFVETDVKKLQEQIGYLIDKAERH